MRDVAVPVGVNERSAVVSGASVSDGSVSDSTTWGNASARRTGGATSGSMPASMSRVRTPFPLPSTYSAEVSVPASGVSSTATFAERATASARANARRPARYRAALAARVRSTPAVSCGTAAAATMATVAATNISSTSV